MFERAIVRTPGKNIINGLTTADLGLPDYQKEEFKKFNILEIDEDESYAANCVWVNDRVLIPKGYPKTRITIEKAGYSVKEVDVSEFRKLDGGLRCLSLRF